MRHAFLVALALVALGVGAAPVTAQDPADAGILAMCDPLIDTTIDEDNGDEEPLARNIRYDLETAVPLTSDAEVIAAIFEEVWDPATDAGLERPQTCAGEPSYLINWAQVMGADQAGQPVAIASGYLSFRKDGSFLFTYEKRPYEGIWTMAGGRMTLSATWLNGGAPLEAAVERVTTPVEYGRDGGETASFDEEVIRIGPFRLLPLQTTVKGMEQACRCAAN